MPLRGAGRKSLHTQSSCNRGAFFFFNQLNIRLKRHPIPGTIKSICYLALVTVELANKLQMLQAKKNQALQFLSLPIHLSPQNNHQRIRSLSPSRMPFALRNFTAT